MNKKVILAFQGTGKTYFCSKNPEYIDLDFKEFPHVDGWLEDYVETLKSHIQDDNIKGIFCNISKELMDKLTEEQIPFTVFAPLTNSEDYEDVKALLLGRMVLRKTQTPQNVGWIEKIKAHFDEWCDPDFFGKTTVCPVSLRTNCIEELLNRN